MFTFLEKSRLTVARDKLYSGIRETQVKAQSQRISWQFSVREHDGYIEWATHPTSVGVNLVKWEKLEDSRSLRIDDESTFDSTSSGVYYILYDDAGNTDLRYLGRITLSSKNASKIKRCVIASTIIGAIRKSQEQAIPQDGKICY